MDKYKEWYESSGYELMEQVGDLHDVETFGFDAHQAGMARYAQGDLAGDERKRIVAEIRDDATQLALSTSRFALNKIADRIEGE